jgi:hypothetical protein
MIPPKPSDEFQRLEALRQYAVLNTPAEETYDDFTLIASYVCDVPIALISLVDEDRQWFKSKVGLDAEETPRDLAFCAHTIMDNQVMVVPDATLDERFSGNPLVTGDPMIRFYAGAPLITPEGHGIGTLCVIDREPRTMTVRQEQVLSALSRQVVVHLELRRVSSRLADSLGKIKVMKGLVPICAYCKNVRDDQGFWASVEKFMEEYSASDFTHGICPECEEKHFGHLDQDNDP